MISAKEWQIVRAAKEIISREGLAVLADFLSVTECLLTAPLYEIPRKPSFLSPCCEVRGFPQKSLCSPYQNS